MYCEFLIGTLVAYLYMSYGRRPVTCFDVSTQTVTPTHLVNIYQRWRT
jgi:hypothetical protein